MAQLRSAAVALAFLLSHSGVAGATEAAMGRYIPGIFALPMSGLVPPPGTYWSSSTVYYSGSAGSSMQIPVAGEIQLGLDAVILGETFSGLWVSDFGFLTDTFFGFSVSVPVQYMDVSASLGQFRLAQSQVALGDIVFGPMLGWHAGTTFTSVGLRVFAPTGAWEEGALDNVGMNYWTFSPYFAFTHLDIPRGLEFSLSTGVDINTENDATDYYSGAMFHLDALVLKSLSEQFAIGVVGSILYQFEDDEGGLAAQLDGFRGQSFAIGPIMRYTAGTMENPINFSFNWAPEFGTENRLRGDAFYFNISGKF